MLRRHFIENNDSNNGIIKISYVADSQQFFCTEDNEIKEGDGLYNANNISNHKLANNDLNEYVFLKENYDINSKIGNWCFKCKTSPNTIATGFRNQSNENNFSTFVCSKNNGDPHEFTQLEISEGVEEIKTGFGLPGIFGVTNETLSTLILPQSLKYIDEGAFFGFTNITNIIGGDNLEYINNLQTDTIIGQVFGTGFIQYLYMHPDQYSKGKVLFKVKIEPNVKVPENFNQYYITLFLGGESIIETIELPDNFTEIYPTMCMNLSKLSTIDLSNVTNIGKEAFIGCTNLKYVDLSNVTNIGEQAFMDSGIEEFTINDDKIENIGNQCFKNCTNLKMAVIPSYWTEFITTSTNNMSMYNNCRNIETVYFNAKKASSVVKTSYGYLYLSRNTIKTVIIGEHVTRIPRKSFYKCALENITYKGTIEQWNLISKDTGWYGDAVTTVVHCTDGDVELERI